jgi:class 3 adenylate cyclase
MNDRPDTMTLNQGTAPAVGANCTKCAADLQPTARFCSVCGTPVATIIDVRSRFMTVLFCDLSNSTAITESLGDEAMFGVITRYQQICTDAIFEHGGFMAKFMGDGMLAYFGYPEAMKNSASG